MTVQRAVIAGASHAGTQLAASLRREGWDGEIVLVGDEAKIREVLSKEPGWEKLGISIHHASQVI